MADVHSASRKPQMYKDPASGKMKVRMVPSKQDVKSEKTLTPAEKRGREHIAKKLPMKDFKKRYGDDAMAVKMATATKIAKKKYESDSETSGMDETKAAPKGYHFTKSGELRKGDADVDGPGGKKLRADPLDKQRSKIPPLPEAVTYHGNPNKDDDARNAARRRALAKQDNLLRKRKAEKEVEVEENYNFKVSHSGKDVHVKARDVGHAIKKAQKGFGNMDLTKAKVKNLGRVGMPANEATDKPPFKEPYTKTGTTTKDQYGNVVKPKNLASFLAKKGMKTVAKESTDAYGKSMDAMASKRKMDAMSSSDKDKLGKLAAMMAKEKKPKSEAYKVPRLAMKRSSYPSLKNTIGRASDESRPSMSAKSATRNVYKNMMGGLKKESVDESVVTDWDRIIAFHENAIQEVSRPKYSNKRGQKIPGEYDAAKKQGSHYFGIVGGQPKSVEARKRALNRQGTLSTGMKDVTHTLKARAMDLHHRSEKMFGNRNQEGADLAAAHRKAKKSAHAAKQAIEKHGKGSPEAKAAMSKYNDHYNETKKRKAAYDKSRGYSESVQEALDSKNWSALSANHHDAAQYHKKEAERHTDKKAKELHQRAADFHNRAKIHSDDISNGSNDKDDHFQYKYNSDKGKEYAKRAREAGAIADRSRSESVEEANSDQNFSKRIVAKMRGGAGAEYLKKKVDQRKAAHAKQDPSAVKQGYGPGVIPPGTAFRAAMKRGMSPSQAANAVSNAFKNRGKPRKLPEETQLDEMKANAAYSKAAKDIKDYAAKNGGIDKKDMMNFAADLELMGSGINILQAGRILDRINKRFKGYDTDVRDRLSIYLKKHGLM